MHRGCRQGGQDYGCPQCDRMRGHTCSQHGQGPVADHGCAWSSLCPWALYRQALLQPLAIGIQPSHMASPPVTPHANLLLPPPLLLLLL